MASGGSLRWFGSVTVLVSALVVGCGGGSSGTGVPPATKVSDLTDAQAKVMCDFLNARQGGYGKTIQCPDGPSPNDKDQAECLGYLVPGVGTFCPTLTAGDLESCANGPMGNVCTFQTAPECMAVAACIASIPTT